ncbi:hypothetical protein EVAR_89615_1 [Eumeta japonica]|uniref:Uncharacterized protein n=1 Tax=Eumeta variegata TaxID=151549 RepID=A0A4C1XQX5_EUMVA|nr:hypothetical protein EVAR_89615_1 [Eumeta japonica]
MCESTSGVRSIEIPSILDARAAESTPNHDMHPNSRRAKETAREHLHLTGEENLSVNHLFGITPEAKRKKHDTPSGSLR